MPGSRNNQFLWHDKSRSWTTSESIAELREGELLVQALASMISTGTERLVCKGLVPASIAEQMKIPYMKGDFSTTFTYGYSLVGVVIEGDQQWLGKRVHLLHPHQRFAHVTANDVFELPGALDAGKATLLSSMETALNIVWDARPEIGDRIVLFGFGLIGTLVSLLLGNIPGLEFYICDNNKQRCEQARSAGFNTLSVSDTKSSAASLAINVSGSSEALQSAIDCTGYEGRVIESSWYGTQASTVQLGGSFHIQRKQIISSQVSTIAARKRGNWDFVRRKQLALELLRTLDTDQLTNHDIDFNDSPLFFDRLRTHPDPHRATVIRY